MNRYLGPNARRRQVLVANYSGYILGDDAIFESLMQIVRSAWGSDVRFSALTALPAATIKNYPIVDAEHVYRYTHSSKTRRHAARMLVASDLMLVGGGDIVEGQTALVLLTLLARLINVPVAYVGVGVLLPNTSRRQRMLASSLRHVSFVATRDAKSRSLLIDMGVPGHLVHTFPDLAVGLPLLDCDGANDLCGDEWITLTRPYVAVNLRAPEVEQYSTTWGESTYEVLAHVCQQLIDRDGFDIVCVPFVTAASQPNDELDAPADDELLAGFARRIDRTGRVHVLHGAHRPSEIAALLGRADFVISMRLHCVILSAMQGVPTLALNYARKVRAFMSQAGLDRYCLEIADISEKTLEQAIESLREQEAEIKDGLGIWHADAITRLHILEKMLGPLSRDPTWLTTVRRRVGYPVIRLLLYAIALNGRRRGG